MCQVMIKNCCRAFAIQFGSASCCGNCGESLLRCPGFSKCGGLLNADGYCEQCLSPKLVLLDAPNQNIPRGATTSFRLELGNQSPAQMPFAVEAVKIRIAGGPWREVELGFEKVRAGSNRSFQVTTPSLDQAGRQGVELMLVLASSWDWRRNEMVFTTSFEINVDETKETIVQQNIHCSGNEHPAGNTIYAPVRIVNDQPERRQDSPPQQTELELIRSGKYEKQLGLLGQGDPIATASTEVEFVGFPQQTAPFRQAIGVTGSLLQFGRSRAKPQGGPNDVRLIVIAENGQVDEAASLSISRTHFTVWLDRGQLMIRALSQHGITVDGKKIPHLQSVPLSHQSRIQLVVGRKSIYEIHVAMECQHDQVQTVRFMRR